MHAGSVFMTMSWPVKIPPREKKPLRCPWQGQRKVNTRGLMAEPYCKWSMAGSIHHFKKPLFCVAFHATPLPWAGRDGSQKLPTTSKMLPSCFTQSVGSTILGSSCRARIFAMHAGSVFMTMSWPVKIPPREKKPLRCPWQGQRKVNTRGLMAEPYCKWSMAGSIHHFKKPLFCVAFHAPHQQNFDARWWKSTNSGPPGTWPS